MRASSAHIKLRCNPCIRDVQVNGLIPGLGSEILPFFSRAGSVSSSFAFSPLPVVELASVEAATTDGLSCGVSLNSSLS